MDPNGKWWTAVIPFQVYETKGVPVIVGAPSIKEHFSKLVINMILHASETVHDKCTSHSCVDTKPSALRDTDMTNAFYVLCPRVLFAPTSDELPPFKFPMERLHQCEGKFYLRLHQREGKFYPRLQEEDDDDDERFQPEDELFLRQPVETASITAIGSNVGRKRKFMDHLKDNHQV